MRGILIASAGLALAGGGSADAQQRPGASYGVPGAVMQAPMANPRRPGPIADRPPVVHTSSQPAGSQVSSGHRAKRWGSKIGGRWWAGANAPGGWAGYRAPHRGWAVPRYWSAPRFYVGDWSNYGLPQPPQGYNWARYYDDAVLIDPRGSVYDTASGIDWDRYDSGAYAPINPGADAAEDSVDGGSGERSYVDRGPPRGDNGLGGAAIGVVAGGTAGNIVAGRGNRVGGTLIGAGIGAAAGYAIDKHEDRGRRVPPPAARYGAGYPRPAYDADYAPSSPYAGDYAAQPYGGDDRQPRSYTVAPGGTWVSPDGVTTVTTASGGPYPAGSTTVIVQSVPVTTTTTTTEYYNSSPYSRRKVGRRR